MAPNHHAVWLLLLRAAAQSDSDIKRREQERRTTDPTQPLSKARRERRLLCTLLTQGDSDIKRREQERRKKTTPSTTLFVVNFDVIRTRERDLADLFGRYGPLRRVQVRFVGQHNGHKADP